MQRVHETWWGRWPLTVGVAMMMGLTGCGGGAEDSPQETTAPAATLAQAASVEAPQEASLAQPTQTAGRLLASNCFQCHGTGGMGGLEKIRGGDVKEVRDYRNLLRKPANQDIMAAHAQGYTDAQIAAIIQYLQK